MTFSSAGNIEMTPTSPVSCTRSILSIRGYLQSRIRCKTYDHERKRRHCAIPSKNDDGPRKWTSPAAKRDLPKIERESARRSGNGTSGG
mmetsp:Transcript_36339/g.84999  ORF Transcript_36339/g.84999 Transcript_36339/m.84999 type:complete len:89 (+) Transcript_36339:115-381(+)